VAEDSEEKRDFFRRGKAREESVFGKKEIPVKTETKLGGSGRGENKLTC